MAGLAAAAGIGAYAVATSAAFGLTKRMDPSLGSLQRNRYIAGGALTLGGLVLAAVASPLIGAGIAAGGLIALAGTQLSFAIDPIFQLGAAPAGGGTTTAAPSIKAVFGNDRQHFSGVFGAGQQQFGAIFGDNKQQFGTILAGGPFPTIGMMGEEDETFGG